MAVDASALSRRSFFRLAAATSALATVPILTEPLLAQTQRRRFHMEAYPAGAIRIDSNENPLGPCAAAATAISGMIAEGGRYDTDLTFKLVETFAAMEGLKSEYVVPYAGSSEPLHFSVLAFTSPEKSFVIADPGYEAGMRAADAKGAKVIKVPLTATHAHDVKAMVSADPNAGVIYICNPNNPTGTTTPREDIEYALANKPKGSILLIDEAYIHFSDATPSLDFVKADKDVIVLRTFSKIYGMAGIRCGFAIGRPDLLEKVQFYGMNPMPITAVAAATASLQDKDVIPQRKKLNAEIRSETFEWLTANNVTFIPSVSNCFMMDTRRPGRDVMAAMAKQDVFIGRVWPVMPTWVRITVGTRAEMTKFQAAYKQVMNATNAELALPTLELGHRFSIQS
ncbi:pyridoxal phosphate-dependent aminotransferase [Silvibacterium sp.]|uniref:pyridoxal phosphate-dependent aminotransferase n=1 Tax=Silvibacterium sp. TaxID=1964179 RepID=UPI0039E3BB3A